MAKKPTTGGKDATPTTGARTATENTVYEVIASQRKCMIADLTPATVLRGPNSDSIIAWNLMEALEKAIPGLHRKIDGINHIVPLTVQSVLDAVKSASS